DLSTSQNADILNAGALLASRGTGAYTIYQSEIQGMNANISIQANKSIKATGTFQGNELTIAPDRNFRLELLAGGAGGIDLSAVPVRVQGTGRVDLITAGTGQDIATNAITTGGGAINLSAANSNLQIGGALASQGGAVTLAGRSVNFNADHAFAAGTQLAVSGPGPVVKDVEPPEKEDK